MQLFKQAENVFCIVLICSLCLRKCSNGYKVQTYLSKYLLPGLVMPEEYELKIFTNLSELNNPEFWGLVRITIQCVQPTKQIILNTKSLYVDEKDVSIKPLTNESEKTEVVDVKDVDKYDQLRITLAEYLVEKNRYKLEIKFTSISRASDSIDSGFIVNLSKQTAFTKLDTLDARLVFPCFDQINMKAKYKLYLGHTLGIKALTNGEYVVSHEITDKPNWTIDEFTETVSMAPFSVGIALLCTQNFSYAEFEHPSSILRLIRVSLADSISNVAEKLNEIVFNIFKFFSERFSLAPYPFDKLDVVVFSEISDTVDSYGLIFMSETYVINAIQESESFSKFEALSKICILISRQWIGHSVTVNAYDEKWLQEGLNHFLQTMCVNKVFSEMEYSYSESNVIDSFLHLLKAEESHEWVLVSPGYPLLSTGPNDYMSRLKSFHLIRMLNLILEPGLFHKFLETYLTIYKSENSSLEEVWHLFALTTNPIRPNILPEYVTVKRIMQSWTSRKGHPLVIVTRDYETGEITLQQKLFTRYEDNVKEAPVIDSWIIPLTYTTQKESEFDEINVREWLTWEGPHVLHHINVKDTEWIIFNLKLEVMARVHYDANNWDMIQDSLLDSGEYFKIRISTRVHLVSDMFALADFGELHYPFIFRTMKYLTHEKFFQPWKVALEEFALIRTRLVGTEAFEPFQRYMRDILEDAFEERLEMVRFWDNLHYQKRKLKLSIIEAACLYELKACVERSLKYIRYWNSDSDPTWPDSTPQAVTAVIHCQKVKHDNKYWKTLWKQFSQKKQPAGIRKSILKVLACSRDTKILKRYLKYSVKDREILPRESLTMFENLITNDLGYKVMKKFFMKKFERIRKFHDKRSYVNPLHYLKILLDITTRDEDLKSLIEFATKKKLNLKDKGIQRSIANSRRHIAWFERHRFSLKTFFKLPMRKSKLELNTFFKLFS